MAVFGLLIRGGPHLACPLFVLVSWTMMPVFDISCPSHDNVLDHAMCVEYRETIAGTNAGWVWNGLSWFSWGCKWRRRWRWSVGGAGSESKEDLKMT
ncbi:hypothetical protein DER46DRAFT_251419 [Fusarium sp. MPI-SDFR-AT-0072]|nr:hypothetical protein DER46DRAFT_251419 [Fusarium sp. MPI-SDFR-AT-0072]